jgi:hypothetical protein
LLSSKEFTLAPALELCGLKEPTIVAPMQALSRLEERVTLAPALPLSENDEPRMVAPMQALSRLQEQIMLAPALALWGLIERTCLSCFCLEDILSRAVKSLG